MNELVKKLAMAVVTGACTCIGMKLVEEAYNTAKDPYKKAVVKQKLNKFKPKKSKKVDLKVRES